MHLPPVLRCMKLSPGITETSMLDVPPAPRIRRRCTRASGTDEMSPMPLGLWMANVSP